MIDDTTASMHANDTCTPTGIPGDGTTPTQEDCAKQGIAYLLATLLPCAQRTTSCGAADSTGNVANPIDRVGLIVFPGLCAVARGTCSSTLPPGSGTGVPAEIGCSAADYTAVSKNITYDYSSAPFYGNYSNYQAVPFQSDYRQSDSTTSPDPNNPWAALAPSSNLVKAVGWYQCPAHAFPGDSGGNEQYGMQDPGGKGTYYADAILQAGRTFVSAGRPNTHDAIVILSDGDANATARNLANSKLDPSGANECQAGINAAEAAESAGVLFFSIAYGAAKKGCSTDTSNSSTCNATTFTNCTNDSPICAMELMADNHVTNPAFANDYQAEQALCANGTFASDPVHHFYNTPTGSSFQAAFQSVGNQLTTARLVPDTAS